MPSLVATTSTRARTKFVRTHSARTKIYTIFGNYGLQVNINNVGGKNQLSTFLNAKLLSRSDSLEQLLHMKLYYVS